MDRVPLKVEQVEMDIIPLNCLDMIHPTAGQFFLSFDGLGCWWFFLGKKGNEKHKLHLQLSHIIFLTARKKMQQ